MEDFTVTVMINASFLHATNLAHDIVIYLGVQSSLNL